MREKLTARQRSIFYFILEHISERGFPPSIREIADRFDIKSPKGVSDHLNALEKKGYIRRNKGHSRSIEIPIDLRRDKGLPIIGQIAAGSPILAEENFEGLLDINELLGNNGGVYALKVKGNSMIDAGILDNDYVIVKNQPRVESGEIGVAYLDSEATVKRIYEEDDKFRLQPENSALEPIYINKADSSFRVGGKVIGVIRKLG